MTREREQEARLEIRIAPELKAWAQAEAARRGEDASRLVRGLLLAERARLLASNGGAQYPVLTP